MSGIKSAFISLDTVSISAVEEIFCVLLENLHPLYSKDVIRFECGGTLLQSIMSSILPNTSSQALRCLEEPLKCMLCFNVYDDPYSLPCQHHFCQKCIQNYIENQCANNNDIGNTCPDCARPFWNKDVSKNTQLSNIVASIRKLISVAIVEENVSPPIASMAPPAPKRNVPISTQDLDELESFHSNILGASKAFKHKFSIVTTRLSVLQEKTVSKFINQFELSSGSENTTHVVCSIDESGLTKRTIKYLKGIVDQKWIVSWKWADESLRKGRILNEAEYEVLGDSTHGCNKAPEMARNTSPRFLFDKLEFVLLQKFDFPHPTDEDLEYLISKGGGTLVSIDDDSQSLRLCICKPDCNSSMIHTFKSQSPHPVISLVWILDCISSFKRIEIDAYQF